MSNMPDDILDEANRVLRQLNEELTMGKVYVVARALATERERCARIAETFDRSFPAPGNDGMGTRIVVPVEGRDIARAIRGSDV